MASASRPAGELLMKSASAVCITSRFHTPEAGGSREGDDSTRNAAGCVYPVMILRRCVREASPSSPTLRSLALLLLEESELRVVFHSLGGHMNVHRARHGDDGRGDGAVVAVIGDAGDERAVDLQ